MVIEKVWSFFHKTLATICLLADDVLERVALLNRKFHISQISHCERLVPTLYSA